jgi:N-acetylglutamate synthase-like GNAT family acetyltransferase
VSSSLIIEVLSKSHHRDDFDCGNAVLNHFLQKIARQHNEKGLSKTFVLIDTAHPNDIIAYMSMVVCEMLAQDIPHQWVNKYPRRIPAAKLVELAVTKDKQRKGFGAILLVDAMQKTLHVSHTMGIAGLFVDAKDEAAKKYYHQFGFIALPDQLDNLFLPLSTIANTLP